MTFDALSLTVSHRSEVCKSDSLVCLFIYAVSLGDSSRERWQNIIAVHLLGIG